MHPMIIAFIMTFVIMIPTAALVGFLIAVARHKNKRKWASTGALIGLVLAVIIDIFFGATCAFCY